MKLLYCHLCGDIIAPAPEACVPRFCRCLDHAVWWLSPMLGVLRLWYRHGQYDPPNPDYNGVQPTWHRMQFSPMAYVIGVHNGFLADERHHSASTVREHLDRTPDSYVFKRIGSLIVRVRPGESNDTDWAEALPGA